MFKNSLDTSQKSFKLDIPSVNHSAIVSFFEIKSPKFFTETIKYRVSTIKYSMFDKVKYWKDWNNPAHGFRKILQDEAFNAQTAVEAATSEDRKFTNTCRALVSNCLHSSVSFMESLIRCMSNAHRELTLSLFSLKES